MDGAVARRLLFIALGADEEGRCDDADAETEIAPDGGRAGRRRVPHDTRGRGRVPLRDRGYHERDNFNQGSFACATINQHGEVAFKAARTAPDGADVFDGTYRANTDGPLPPIVEDPTRAQFTLTGHFTHLNDKGEVALGANLAGEEFVNVILRGDGERVRPVTQDQGVVLSGLAFF